MYPDNQKKLSRIEIAQEEENQDEEEEKENYI